MNLISEIFDFLMTEIDIFAENTNQIGCELMRESKYIEVDSLLRKAEKLQIFRERISELNSEWDSIFSKDEFLKINKIDEFDGDEDQTFDNKITNNRTKLLVKFTDGTVISEKNAAITFAKTLEIIGFDKISPLGIKVNSEDLIGNEKSKKYNDTRLSGFYIRTHSSTNAKKNILDRISNEIGLNIETLVI